MDGKNTDKEMEHNQIPIEEYASWKYILLFYIITTIIAYSIWIPMALGRLGIINFSIPVIIGQSIGGFSPLLTAIILSKFKKSNIDTKKIFGRGKRQKINPIFYVFSISLFPCIAILIAILYYNLQIETELAIFNPAVFNDMGYYIFAIMPVLFLAGNLSSPLLEEPGWRGVGTHNLQPKLGKHIGSFIIGSYWWLWHLPLWIAIDIEISIFSYFILVAQSFIIDSVYNMSKQKIIVAMFFHSSQITTFTLFRTFPNDWITVILLLSTAIIFRIIEFAWFRRSPK